MTKSSPSTSNSDRWNFKAMTLAGRRIWRDCRGSMVIEFALLTPVLLGVFFAIIQFGFIMFTRQEMLYAAREAARSYSVGLNDAGAAQALALSLLSPNNTNNSLTFTVTVTEPGGTSGGGNSGGDANNSGSGGSGDSAGSGGSGDADNGSTSTGDVTVTITVPMSEASLVSFLDDNILSGDLEVSATMFVQGVPEVEEDSGGSGGGSGGSGGGSSNSASNNGGSSNSGSNNSGSNNSGSNNSASGNASFRDYLNGGNRFA